MRLMIFKTFENHAHYQKHFKKLSPQDLNICTKFINDFDHLNSDDFQLKINRLFLDKPKPKHWALLEELLTCTNARFRFEKEEGK